MKILLLSSRFFPHVGGVEKVIESLAEKLSKDNEVIVLSSLDKDANFLRIESPIVDVDGYKLKRIWMNIPRSFLGAVIFPYRFLHAVYLLVIFLKKQKPDVVNFHFPDDVSIYLWFARIFCKFPLIVNIHGNDLHIFSKMFFHKYFIKSELNDAKKIIVNSKYMKDDMSLFAKIESSKIVIIPNGIDVSYINNIPEQKYIESDYLFFVGRFVYKKGVDILIRAFSEIKDKNLKLVIEGKGEEKGKIERLIIELGMSERIILVGGNLSEEQKFAYMKGALIGVVPSRIEPFGIVALEYLACGIPLIASNTGGLVDILEDKKTCVFFENENHKDLTEKIDALFEDSKLRKTLSKNGQELVRKYTLDEVSKKYLETFNSVLMKS